VTGLAAIAIVASAATRATVIHPVANMYSQPSAESDVVSQAIYGANVDLIEQNGAWAHIRTADDCAGWALLSALRVGRSYATQGRVAEVQNLSARLYRETDVGKHAPLVTVPFATRLEVLQAITEPAEKTRWFHVRLPDERLEWVQRGDVAFDVKPLDVPHTLELSKRITRTGVYVGNGKFTSNTTYRTPTIHIEDLNDRHWAGLLVAVRRARNLGG